ncbi:MAG: hypothetical protein MJA27_07570 [Pseudanabaenales cyanobacterium]|nr:hypothetical protein [Pseudanabaenales cyanobacterium]
MYYYFFYPAQKIKRFKSNFVLEVDGADTRYSDLPLGNLGIFYQVNEKRRIRVIFPKLTPEGDVKYIYSWHNLQSIRIPASGKKDIQSQANLRVIQELAFLMKEHIEFVEPEILKLKKQWQKINELLDLVGTSDFYASQKGFYERALFQVENLLDKAEELEQVYIRFIREVLIGRKVVEYDPNLLPNDSLPIDRQYKRIREEYRQAKDTATAYAELLHTRQV